MLKVTCVYGITRKEFIDRLNLELERLQGYGHSVWQVHFRDYEAIILYEAQKKDESGNWNAI